MHLTRVWHFLEEARSLFESTDPYVCGDVFADIAAMGGRFYPVDSKEWRRGWDTHLALSESHHVFSDMRGDRMNIGHFYALAYSNCFYCLIRLGPNSNGTRLENHCACAWLG